MASDKATGRWIAEEVLDPEWEDGETHGAFQPCPTEEMASQVARYASEIDGWKVDVYPETTVTGIMDGSFKTVTSAEEALAALWQYGNWAYDNQAAAAAWEDAHGVRRSGR